MMNDPFSGVLPIYKPAGIGSFDVIRILKRSISVKKIGHGGTLDNFAEGVLPILIGEATKIFDYMLKTDKCYEAVAQFGIVTETDDKDGTVVETSDITPGLSDIERLLPGFQGEIEQIPPRYSALKINGQRSSDLARSNRDFEVKPRKARVSSIEMLSYDQPARQLRFRVECSSGTYIRSIARDLGSGLQCGAHLIYLKRIKSGGIDLQQCVMPETVNKENLPELLIPIEKCLSFMPRLDAALPALYYYQGKPLTEKAFLTPPQDDGEYCLFESDRLIAIVGKQAAKVGYLRVFGVDE